MRHIISILLENEAGALSRVAGLFSARGYNIETLTVAPTEDMSLSRLTIVTSGSDEVIEQITKQLNKLIDVIKVVDLSEAAHIERELMLIKVRASGKDREEMKRIGRGNAGAGFARNGIDYFTNPRAFCISLTAQEVTPTRLFQPCRLFDFFILPVFVVLTKEKK